MKTFVVGDIHGAYLALIQCIERSEFNPKEDLLIQLGDVADGWSQTSEVVQYLIDLKDHAICIRGNHDQWTNEWMQSGIAQHMWMHQGGEATKNAYDQKVMYHDFEMNEHRTFFKNQHDYYIDEKNRVFVHGGYLSDLGCGHDPKESGIYYWDRELFSIALSGHMANKSLDGRLPRRLRPHHEIFIGHTTTMNWNYSTHNFFPPYGSKIGDRITTPMNACNVWNLDTGGGFNGKVTIMNVDTKEYWQSDLVKTLYPHEAGR